MSVIKAVAIQQPEITRLAAREVSIDVKTWSTGHRGRLLLVSATTPRIEPAGYAIAIATLVDCRPMTRADARRAGKAPYPGAQAWVLEEVEPLQIFPVDVRSGLFDVAVPSFGLRTVKKIPLVPASYQRAAAHRAEPGHAAGYLRQARRALEAASASLGDDSRATAARRGQGLDAADVALSEIATCLETLIGEIAGLGPGPATGRSAAAPSATARARPAPAGALAPSGRARARRDVLVVDGHPLVVRGIGRLLGPDHDVRAARSVASAFAEVFRREPDVLICEYDLGLENSARLLEAMARAFPRVRRILYSCSGPEIWLRTLDHRLVDCALRKPASPELLLRAVVGDGEARET